MLKPKYGNVICNLNVIHKKYTYQHHIYQISSIQALPTFQHPYIQETTKLIHDFIYIQETSYMKWKADTA